MYVIWPKTSNRLVQGHLCQTKGKILHQSTKPNKFSRHKQHLTWTCTLCTETRSNFDGHGFLIAGFQKRQRWGPILRWHFMSFLEQKVGKFSSLVDIHGGTDQFQFRFLGNLTSTVFKNLWFPNHISAYFFSTVRFKQVLQNREVVICKWQEYFVKSTHTPLTTSISTAAQFRFHQCYSVSLQWISLKGVK